MDSVLAQLNKIELPRVISYELSGGELLVTLTPKAPDMVNKLIKVNIPRGVSSSKVITTFNEMVKAGSC